jgi:hypothetical protein
MVDCPNYFGYRVDDDHTEIFLLEPGNTTVVTATITAHDYTLTTCTEFVAFEICYGENLTGGEYWYEYEDYEGRFSISIDARIKFPYNQSCICCSVQFIPASCLALATAILLIRRR